MTNQSLRTLAEAKSQIAFPVPELHMLKEIRKERRIGYVEGFIAGRTSVTREQVVRVLARHELAAPNGGTASWAWCKCSCGYEVQSAGMTRDYVFQLAEDHRADQVLALFGKVAGDE